MEIDEFEFRYFFNAGLDRRTFQCDVEGSDVYRYGHYIGSVPWKMPDELEALDDEELTIVLAENGIYI